MEHYKQKELENILHKYIVNYLNKRTEYIDFTQAKHFDREDFANEFELKGKVINPTGCLIENWFENYWPYQDRLETQLDFIRKVGKEYG